MDRKALRSAAETLLFGSLLAAVWTGGLAARAPRSEAPSRAAAAQDYTRENTVVELYRDVRRFEKDGRGTEQVSARIRIQSEDGVKAYGQLVFHYNAFNEKLDIRQVSVRKADGSLVKAGPEAAQDLAMPVDAAAPEYTDTHEVHVTVPGLRPGDVLEYEMSRSTLAPLAPGEYWGGYDFFTRTVCLSEQFILDIPAESAPTIRHAPAYEPKVKTAAGRKVYTWDFAQLEGLVARELAGKAKAAAPKAKKAPAWKGSDISYSSFRNWEAIGHWYAGLERDRRAVTPALKAKADELVKGLSTDEAKVEALYTFVARTNRYVSLSFGTGRYQPHPAEETLRNQYGDCKDKHTLLAALLGAEGYRVNSVLINSSRALMPELPSPGQFNHIITQVDLGDRKWWMDATAETAPFRLLYPKLRKQQALVIPASDTPRLEETPLDPPFPCYAKREVTGKIAPDGSSKLHLRMAFRGDSELEFRATLAGVPKAQRGAMFKKKIGADKGEGGKGVQVDFEGVDTPSEPVVLLLDVDDPRYLSVKNGSGSLSYPAGDTPIEDYAENDGSEPLRLGAESEFISQVDLELPPGLTPQLPLPVTVHRDYADYTTDYRMDGQRMLMSKKLVLRWREIPYDRREDWEAFRRTILADQKQRIAFESATDFGNAEQGKDIEQVVAEAQKAWSENRFAEGQAGYLAAMKLDPARKGLWRPLGRCYLGQREYEKAIGAFQKAQQENPFDEWAFYDEAQTYAATQRYAEAIRLFRKQIEISPLNFWAHMGLAQVFLEQQDWSAALPELEKAVSITPDHARAHFSLGQAQLNLGQEAKAMAAFDKALKLDSSPEIWNEIAYQLSLKNLQLERANQYAESAVSTTAASLRNMDLDSKQRDQQRLTASLASYWDTKGWIEFQKGALDKAEHLIAPAWELSWAGDVGDHLGQIAEKRGEAAKAADFYALALAGEHPGIETRGRLSHLLGSEAKVDRAVEEARKRMADLRVIHLQGRGAEELTAECYLSFTGDGALEKVIFPSVQNRADALSALVRAAGLGSPVPKDLNARIVRRAVLRTKKGGDCTLTLFPARALAGLK